MRISYELQKDEFLTNSQDDPADRQDPIFPSHTQYPFRPLRSVCLHFDDAHDFIFHSSLSFLSFLLFIYDEELHL